MEKKWVLKPPGEKEIIESLAAELTISPVLSNLLVQRGIHDYDQAKKFFRPEYNHLYDPFLMKDMDKAVARIKKALDNNEKILIYGDYDVDGTTSVALVYSFLKKRHENLNYYIPNRYTEGYGISTLSIDWAKNEGITLIIALDCGIKSVDKVEYASSLGIDYVICDHHLPEDRIPAAAAVLDPKRPDCSYPFKELSGCGIGFKLIQGLAKDLNADDNEVNSYLDLVVVSIAADIVNITDENRVLAYYGLKKLNENPRPGIKALIELSGIRKFPINISDIVFTISPRINAAGRMKDAKESVKLLLAENIESARESGGIVNSNNVERIVLDQDITKHAIQMIKSDPDFRNKKTTVVFHPEWNKGVIGIVASRLIEKFYKPTIVLTLSNGKITGSARSVKKFNIYDAINSCSDLLDEFGGHNFAAGLTLKQENLQPFIERFEQAVASTIHDDMLVQEIEIDSLLDLSLLDMKFVRVLKQFGPFGPGNMTPVFATNNVNYRSHKVIKENHLMLTVNSENSNVDAIGFQLAYHESQVIKRNPFNICYTVEENVWNGNTTIKLNLKDIKHS